MKVSIYVGEDYQKLDLFEDENIFIIQKINDIEKLSNVFSDSSLSFTIPASSTNNKILKHYYDIYINNGYNANIRIPAYIELDSLAYKFGVIQIEGVEKKDNYTDNYKITFFSKNTQLSDLFGNNTIDTIEYPSELTFTNNSTNFYKTINDPTFLSGSIITPLIAYTDRDWNYGTGDIFDISIDSGSILNTELKPALQVIKVIEAIENEYNISFSRDFFGTPLFEKLYIWMNSKAAKPSGQVLLDIQNGISTSGPTPNNYFTCSVNTTDDIFTIIDNSFDYDSGRVFNLWVNAGVMRDPLSNEQFPDVYFTLTVIDDDTNEVFLTQTVKSNGASQISFLFDIPQTTSPTTRNLKFYLSSSVNFTFTSFNINFDYRISPGVIQRSGTLNNSGNYLNVYSVNYLLPSIKVIDFITGLMKMFKLIIRPISTTSFYIDTIDNFYFNGNILDITKYVDIKSIQISRPEIYSLIKFKYEKTENVLGKKFRETNDPIDDEIGYGDLKGEYLIDTKNELEIKLPFENMLFERLIIEEEEGNITTEVCIGQSCKLEDDETTLNPNDSKPILFFNNGIIDISATPIKMKHGGSVIQTINEYYLVGNTNNAVSSSVTNSINWGAEIDPWHLVEIQPSLYLNFWKGWMDTIYDLKQRKFKFKAILPPRYIQEISLNDRLIIGDTRYKINDYKINLVTGQADLNLFIDIY